MTTSARLVVDLDALAANHARLRTLAGEAEVAPVVKADAYGLGAGPVSRRLWAEGARTFYVARVAEGERLRDALGAERPAEILVLDGCPDGAAGRLRAARLTPVLNSLAQIESWGAGAPGVPAALQVDTGINRLGLRPEEALSLLQSDRLRRLDLRWLLSHFARASEGEHAMNEGQAASLRRVAEHYPELRVSLANSAGTHLAARFRHHQVRPGVTLFGGGPFDRAVAEIRAVATLTAPVLQVRTVPPGETVGYGARWTAERPTRVAILAAGYADGVLRSSSPGGYAWADGARLPLLGAVSMDLVAVNATEAPGLRPGSRVELWGANRLIDEAAEAAGTIAYELLVRAGARAERVYLGEAD